MENRMESLSFIKSYLPSLKGVEARIGTYIVNHPEKVVHMTVAQLAKEASVSQGSIISFCRSLRFGGFTDLKIGLAADLQTKDRFLLGDIKVDGEPKPYSVMAQIFQTVFCMLQDTLGLVPPDTLAQAVEAIDLAKQVEFYGVGTSAPIAWDAYYRMMRIGVNAYACVDPHIMLISANRMGQNKTAVAISHTGRTKQTVDALKKAKEKGATTICITSNAGSPITHVADITLLTSTAGSSQMEEATAARIAHIALLDSLCTCVAMKHRQSTRARQEQMGELLETQRY